MNKNKIGYALVALLVLVLVLAGCGGGGHSDSSGSSAGTLDTDADAFVGTWTGTYQQTGDDADTDHHGTITVTIARYVPTAASVGTGVGITGTVEDASRGAGTVGGTFFDRDTTLFSGLSVGFPSATGDLYKGRPTVDARGHLVGTFGLYLGDVSVPTHFDLAPVAAP